MPCAALGPHCSRVLAQPSSSWCVVAPVQETARETLAQVEATPAELIVDYDPDEIELKKIQKPGET